MLKRNKALSIVMTLCLCLAVLAPVFIAAPAAEAAVTYTMLSTPSLVTNTPAQNLGVIKVDLDSCAAVAANDVLTISLPSEITLPATATTVATRGAGAVEVVVPTNLPDGTGNGLAGAVTYTAAGPPAVVGSAVTTATRTAIDITMTGAGTGNPGLMYIYMGNVTVGSIDGDVTAKMLAPSNSAFAMGSVVVGKASSAGGSTVSSILSVKTIGSGGGACDIISVAESAPATLTAGEVIKVKLPNGFTWAAVGAGTQSWGWASPGITPTVVRDGTDPRILLVTVGNPVAPAAPVFPSVAGGLSGRVNFAAGIVVDDTIAKTGEITARIYSNNGNVTETDLVIANYGTFGVKVNEGTKKDLIAGKYDQKIGEFYIEEDIANSLISNRSIKFTLPKGVKWSGDYSPTASGMVAAPAPEKGNATLGAFTCASPYDTLKTTVTQAAVPTKSKFKFKDFKVDVAPDFTGPITITVSGTAGVEGEVVVAEVKPAVELKAEDLTNVRIGEQNQVLGTLILTETKKENIALNSANIDVWDDAGATPDIGTTAGNITLTLPGDAEWGPGYPTVEVTDGDLELKLNQMSKFGRTLSIPVKSESSKPSTIKITNMKATLYRTLPEGDFKIAVAGTAINETGGVGYAFPQFEDNKIAVAKCVTPAPAEGTAGAASGQFRIDSNIYQVNGVSKIMDVAPYVKNNRTYVPVRFLGYALGLTDADIIWDEATQKVTFTQGSNVVELTIGSTTYTVNGESKTMDVAPEITNGRTMLPARYVAEGLGYVVGWDPATQTVLVSK